MEFLHPPIGDKDNVILLLVTSENNRTKIRRYEWDSSRHVSTAVEREEHRQRVANDQQLPLLLIPLKMSTAFLLVFEDRIATYTGILTGHATPYVHVLDHLEDPEEPGSSRAKPVFTQWARPRRHDTHSSIQDNIYLCREDGVVRFLEISEEIPHMIDSSHAAGHLETNVNTAFASLDCGDDFDDLLAAGGDMSDGGLWLFGPRLVPTRLASKITNWTPAIDMVALGISSQPPRPSGYVGPTIRRSLSQKRIFVPTGRGAIHGAATEVQLGIEASLLPVMYETEKGFDQMWVLPDPSGTSIHFLVSYPTRTKLLSAYPADQMQDEDEETSLDTGAQTLAAGLTEDGVIIQVTASSIRAAQPGNRNRGLVIDLETEVVLKANIMRSEKHGCLLLIAVKVAEEVSLRWAKVRTDRDEVLIQSLGEPQILSAEPSCLSLKELESEIVALVGSLAGSLQLYTRNGSSLRIACTHTFQGDFAICNSIALIYNAPCFRLVCGLRNGSVETILLVAPNDGDDGELQLIPQENLSLGNTSVSVIIDENSPKRALITCGKAFCIIEYDLATSDWSTLTKIWITHKYLSSNDGEEIVPISQPEIRIPEGGWGFADEHLFCIEGNHLRQVDIGKTSQPHMVTRRSNLDGTPSRIIYSEKLGRLIVLYTKIRVQPAQRGAHHSRMGQRSLQTVLGFLDPNKPFNRPDPATTGPTRVLHEAESKRVANIIFMQECKPGERFLGMTEWFPTNGPNKFHMLVVHTMLVHDGDKLPTGRLIFYTPSIDSSGYVTLKHKKSTDLNAPVYAVVPYGSSSLIYSCGNVIYLHTLDLSSDPLRWLSPATFRMGSRGAHISAHMPFVFVTTANESLLVLKVEKAEPAGQTRDTLLFHYSDEMARDGIFHLAIPEQGLVLTSSKDCLTVGLWMAPESRISKSLTTVFQADLPGSITRFCHLTRPAERTDMLSNMSADGRLADPILGSSTDGTFYQLDILDEPTWRLLRFIVNMAKRNPIICPFRDTYQRASHDIPRPHIEPSAGNTRHRHINGDILIRLLERGAVRLLQDMLQRTPEDDYIVDFDTAHARQERFQELMVDAGLGHSNLATVVRWISKILERAL